MLLDHHLNDLKASGLNDQTIAEAGFYSESDPREIGRMLNWNRPASRLGSCLVIPFRQLNG